MSRLNVLIKNSKKGALQEKSDTASMELKKYSPCIGVKHNTPRW